MTFALSLHIGATHIHVCPTLVVYCLYSTPTSLYTYTIYHPYIHAHLCLSPRLGFILPCSLLAQVCMETKELTTSLSAADASLCLPLCGFALRAYGSVVLVVCHCICIRCLCVSRADSVAAYLADGTPFAAVLVSPCAFCLLSEWFAWFSWHPSPPLLSLSPMHLLSALLRFSVWRDTHFIPLCTILVTAALYGGC